MSSINEKVVEKFSAWAEQNEDKHVFPEISQIEKTYYTTRDSEKTYMMEYSFKTVPELKKALEEYDELQLDSDILKMLAVEIYQNRFKSELEVHIDKDNGNVKKETEEETKLPEFIYIF